MQFRSPDATAWQPDRRMPLQRTPTTVAMHLVEPPKVADSTGDRDDLDANDLGDDLKFHARRP